MVAIKALLRAVNECYSIIESLIGNRYPSISNVYELISSLHGSKFVLCRSRGGRPIYALRYGDKGLPVLIWGGGDANEPLGVLSSITLAKILELTGIHDKLGLSVFIVPLLDPDSYVLNKWFDKSYDPKHYAMWSYRPAINNSPEYTFDKQHLPETRGLVKLIKDVKPFIVISLHSQPYPGSYVLISKEVSGLRDIVVRLSRSFNAPFINVKELFEEYKRIDVGIYSIVGTLSGVGYVVKRGFSTVGVIPDIAEFYDLGASIDKPISKNKVRKSMDVINNSLCKCIEKAVNVYNKLKDLCSSHVLFKSFEDNYSNGISLDYVEVDTIAEYIFHYLYRKVWRSMMIFGQLSRIIIEACRGDIEFKDQLKDFNQCMCKAEDLLRKFGLGFMVKSIRVKVAIEVLLVLHILYSIKSMYMKP